MASPEKTKGADGEEGSKAKSRAAPQTNEDTANATGAADAAVIFFVGFGHFLGYVFRVSVLAYFFWTGVIYIVSATLMIVGFQTQGPTISNNPACPAKQSAYMLTALWYLLGVVALITAYGYTTIEAMEPEEFVHFSASIQVLGFLTKVVPTWSRIIHLFSLCQLNTIAIMVLFLPECNRAQLVYIVATCLVFWWIQIFFGLWAKRTIFIPPFLYDAPRPSRTFLRELHSMMRSIGP